jgi:cytochrome c
MAPLPLGQTVVPVETFQHRPSLQLIPGISVSPLVAPVFSSWYFYFVTNANFPVFCRRNCMNKKGLLLVGSLLLIWAGSVSGEVDEKAAEKLMKKSGCFKCHSVDKKKDAPPYKEIAAKLKAKPDPEKELYTHLTTNPKVKVDGKEETHDSLKSKKEEDIRNVVGWILSR